MVTEEEAKLVPKNRSDCESNGASSAAANGNYDLCWRTPTSELTMDEISPASLIKHDDRSESTLIGLRNCPLQRLLRASSFIAIIGFSWWLLYRLFLLLLATSKFFKRLDDIDQVLVLTALLALPFFALPVKDFDWDIEIEHTAEFRSLIEALFSDETVNTEYVNHVHDSAADSISDTTDTDFSPWERGGCIGTGGFGIVYVDRNRITGDTRAVKELKNIENAESIIMEIKILSQLEHPNIVKYYGHEIDGHKASVYMEFIQPGSLKNYILERGALHETLIRKFISQILSGLVYLHSKRVVHRDLKPDNILVDSLDIVKLVDFGVSKHLVESVGNHSMFGTPYYAAPEVLLKTEYKSSREASAVDIWSLGCVIIEMLSGKHPWPDCEPVQAFWKVSSKKQRPPIPDKLCKEGKHFLELCFGRTPADRPSAAELQDHPFVKPQTYLTDGQEYKAELDSVVEIIGVLA